MNRQTALSLLVLLVLSLAAPVSWGTETATTSSPAPCNADRTNWTVGLLMCTEEATVDYVLMAPIPSNTTYLIDQEGRQINSWTSPGGYRPALSAYLLPDGSLLRTGNMGDEAVGNFSGGGTGGVIERLAWDGTLMWSWNYSSEERILHHDIEPMPNGNILAIAWEEIPEEEALAVGRNPAFASDSPNGQNNVWPDHIIEIEPVGTNDANIVWEWRAWDHLVQDFNESLPNYGVIADHPRRLNVNHIGGTGNSAGRADWMHCNGIDYNELLDQIALSCRSMNEIYIIDHSTTTEEASTSLGGNSGFGGDFLYRWGNPQVYNRGDWSHQRFYAQHDVQWVNQGHPLEGGLMVFNNGNGRAVPYSSVDIVMPQMNESGYILNQNSTFGPMELAWTWDRGEDIYSASVSGAQALSNGHVLVTQGTKGTMYEINRTGEIVWRYVNPVGPDGAHPQGEAVPDGNRAGTTLNAVFKATHYTASYVESMNVNITVGTYLESWHDACPQTQAWGLDANGDGCVDDTDGDGVPDHLDACSEGPDDVDEDADGVPDACDEVVDNDGDGVPNTSDACEGHDDGEDMDADGVPDGCDPVDNSVPQSNQTNTTLPNVSEEPQLVYRAALTMEGNGQLLASIIGNQDFNTNLSVVYELLQIINGSSSVVVTSTERTVVGNETGFFDRWSIEIPDGQARYCLEVRWSEGINVSQEHLPGHQPCTEVPVQTENTAEGANSASFRTLSLTAATAILLILAGWWARRTN